MNDTIPALLTPDEKRDYWYIGPNPTADLVVFYRGAKGVEILLNLRSAKAFGEMGLWALPGGFVESNDAPKKPALPGEKPKKTRWKAGKENPLLAALREAKEESDLTLPPGNVIYFVGRYENPKGRPSWTRKYVFTTLLRGPKPAVSPINSEGEIVECRFWPLSDLLGLKIAFDHRELIAKACQTMEIDVGNRLKV